jgi:alpha-galactosidase
MMKKLLSLSLIIMILFVSCSRNNESPVNVDLSKNWKFKTGDDRVWAKPEAEDSGWDSISVARIWEEQGHDGYDGYAWYRTKVFIPSSLKDKAFLKETLNIILGKIDDCDQFYLNGIFIGENNKIKNAPTADSIFEKATFWDIERKYAVPVNNPAIQWDKENVLAVRVYDHGGGGGFYGSRPGIQMLDLSEKIIFDKSTHSFSFEGDKVNKTYLVKNTSQVNLKGDLTITCSLDRTKEELFKQKYDLELKPGESAEFPIAFKEPAEASIVNFVFKHDHSDYIIESSDEVPYILTPKPGDEPRINGAKIVGVRPGRPFLFYIPVTGIRPITYEAQNLPQGLILDANRGIITGKVAQKGNYKVTLIAKNSKGEAAGELLVKVGDQIMLTPPMGWNSWNCWGLSVDQQKVVQSAHVFKEKGLMNHGWAFINIDDGWEAKRDTKGEILTNEKFPNMKALGDSLHKMGLKFGIYSSPGPFTCGGYTGSYQYELQDAKTYAKWGIDYLKYDWCSYGQIAKDNSASELKKPYFVMQKALSEVDRDIVYSLCQYGMGNVWEWGNEVGGNLWRTTGDITDTWESLSSIGFNQISNAPFAKPGNWNDPDMLIVGWVGWGPSLHPTRLTVNEQYTHISMWSLLSAPLLIGCDLTRLDDFTLNLLTNDEVIGINQDPLGKQAVPKMNKDNVQVWVKDLEDGTKAVGIFNLSSHIQKVSIPLSLTGLSGKQSIRDVWRQKDLGTFETSFETNLSPHGVTLVRVSTR